jgi:hypothetical protein
MSKIIVGAEAAAIDREINEANLNKRIELLQNTKLKLRPTARSASTWMNSVSTSI